MMALWAGIIILSGSWSFLTDIFVPDTLTGIGLLVTGSALISFSLRNAKPFTFDKKFLFAAIPLFLAAIYTPFPYNSGFWITFLSLATLFFKPKFHVVWMWARVLCVAGVILMAQAAIFPFFFKFSPLVRDLPFWADAACGLLQIFGSDCAVSNNTVFVQATKEVYPFSTTIEKLAVYGWLNLIVAMMLVVLSFKANQKFRTIIFILLSGLIYLAIRYIGMILIYANTGQLRIFWNPWISVGSFIPLIFLFASRIGLDKDLGCYLAIDDNSLGQRSPKMSLIVFTGFFSGIFCIVASWGFNDPGIMLSLIHI